MIILDRGTDSELGIVGLGYSPDNGEHFFVTNTIKGRVFRQRDVDMLWPLLVDRIKSTMSIKWDDIQDKPVLVTKVELDQRLARLNIPITMSWGQITGKPDLVLKSELPSTDGLAKENDLASVKATAERAISKAGQAQTTADSASKMVRDDATLIKRLSGRIDGIHVPDVSSVNTNKKPSDYPDGFSYELKSLNVLGIDRSQSHASAKTGDLGLLTTKAVSYNGTKYVRQVLEQLDNARPLNYARNGMNNNWFAWEASTTW